MCWIAVAYHHTNVYWKCCRKLQKYAIAGDKDDCVLKMIVSKANYLSSKPFGGDGWCDTINNRAYCQYDGGDCCPSTLSTKKVKLNPFKRSILTQWLRWESNKPCVSLKWASSMSLCSSSFMATLFHTSQFSILFHICSGKCQFPPQRPVSSGESGTGVNKWPA